MGGSGCGGIGGGGAASSVTGTGAPSAGGGSVIDPRAVSVVVTLPGPHPGHALSDYGPI